MKILVMSDLHLDWTDFWPKQTEVDVVVIAGDIWMDIQAVYWARKTWPNLPIVYVAGNHEFYDRDRLDVIDRLRQSALEHEVNFLENDEAIINGVRFLGCTLWTDFMLYDKYAECIEAANAVMNDFRLIWQNERRFLAQDASVVHQQSKDWLKNKLINEPFDGSTVVVTHHAPHWNSVADEYKDDLVSAAFVSRLDHLMGYSKLWIHGHTHTSFDYEVNGTRVVCNPRGYTGRWIENEYFDPYKIVEVP